MGQGPHSTATAFPAPGLANASSAAGIVFAVCSYTVAKLSWGRDDGFTGTGGIGEQSLSLGHLKTKSEKCRKQRGAWALKGLGRVLIDESWVSGGAPMPAFGGEADEDQRPSERPLIANNGHSRQG